jgi:hypothetical protein
VVFIFLRALPTDKEFAYLEAMAHLKIELEVISYTVT